MNSRSYSFLIKELSAQFRSASVAYSIFNAISLILITSITQSCYVQTESSRELSYNKLDLPTIDAAFYAAGSTFTPEEIIVEVDGCASGYTGTSTAANLNFELYKGDHNCRAKVLQFTSEQGEVYTIKSGEIFGYTPGSQTIFESNLLNTITVITNSNLSSPLLLTDEIDFSFIGIDAGVLASFDTNKNIVRVSATTGGVTEGDGVQATYTITKVTEIDQNPLTVYYTMTGSTVAGTDFVAPTGSVTIPANETDVDVTIDLINDTVGEQLEVMTLTISDNANYYHYDDGHVLVYDEDSGIPTQGLVMHLDPSSLSNNAGTVDGWTDLSVSGQSVGQNNTSLRPLYSTGTFSGYDAAFFDGVDDYLQLTNSADINSTGPFTEKHIFFAFETGSDVNRRQIIYEQGTNTEGIFAYIDSGQLYFLVIEGSQSTPVYVSSAIQPNKMYHATLVFNTVLDQLDGYLFSNKFGTASGLIALGNHSSPGIGGSNGAKVLFHDGTTATANTNFGGSIAEVVYYNGAVQTGTIPSVQQFLASKYAADPVVVSVEAITDSVVENSGSSSSIKLSKSYPQAFDLTVDISVTGTALEGVDFSSVGNQIIIPAFTTEVNIPITPIDDLDVESSTESVTISIVSNANYEIGFSPATVNIVDDESVAPVGDYVMWLTAETGVITSGTNVTNWTDSSAYGQVVSQGTVASQPTLAALGIAGRNSIVFDGVDDLLMIDDSSEINLLAYDEKSIGTVFETSADITSRQIIYEEGSNQKGMAVYIDVGNLYYHVWGTGTGDYFISTAISANTIYRGLFSFSSISGDLNMSLNGTDHTPVSGVGTLPKHNGNIGVGAINGQVKFHDGSSSASGNEFNGQIADVIYYNSILTSTEKTSLLLYYSSLYP